MPHVPVYTVDVLAPLSAYDTSIDKRVISFTINVCVCYLRVPGSVIYLSVPTFRGTSEDTGECTQMIE